jgi:plastocyanin
MNKNILIALIVIVVLAAGFVMVKNSSKTQPAGTANQTQTPTAMTEPSKAMKASVSATPEAMSQNTVTLTADGFSPATVTIKKGDKVVWVNKSGDTATVNSDNHPTHLLYPMLNLGSFNDGEKLELVFDKAGKYTYHDHLHPSRRGTVVVE